MPQVDVLGKGDGLCEVGVERRRGEGGVEGCEVRKQRVRLWLGG